MSQDEARTAPLEETTENALRPDERRLIWVDMEMTGLDPDTDRIIEVALVITDMAMPVLDGPPMIRAIHAIDANVPIVGSSGLTGLDDSTVWRDVGVKHWVSKPYRANALLATIDRALRGVV